MPQLKVADWTLTYEEQCTKHNLGIVDTVCEKKDLHFNCKDFHYLLLSLDGVQNIFAWTYNNFERNLIGVSSTLNWNQRLVTQ
jgi:hypothetical protein